MWIGVFVLSLYNYFKSFFYDVYYFFISSAKIRAGANNYKAYLSQKIYPDYLKNGGAMSHIQDLAIYWCKGQGLDIGSGIWPITGARPVEDSSTENAYQLACSDNSQDYIFSSHLLEHLAEPVRAIDEWKKKLKSNGIVFLYLPHHTCQMWTPENLKYHAWLPKPNEVVDLFSSKGFEFVEGSVVPDIYFSYYLIFKKVDVQN